MACMGPRWTTLSRLCEHGHPPVGQLTTPDHVKELFRGIHRRDGRGIIPCDSTLDLNLSLGVELKPRPFLEP